MLASCPRSRRKDVSLTVTSSISRVTSCRLLERIGHAAQERLRRRPGADPTERREQERVLALAEPDAALPVDERGDLTERAAHVAHATGRKSAQPLADRRRRR